MKRTRLHVQLDRGRSLLLAVCLAMAATVADGFENRPTGKASWYKGNLHAHSLWSDGDDFPEMVADWYKQHRYQFLALTDHDRLMHGEHWATLATPDAVRRMSSNALIEKCRKRFGTDWVTVRQKDRFVQEVKLKTFDEVRAQLNEPDKFLLLQGEEIFCRAGNRHVYLNAINLQEVILAKTRPNATDAIQAILGVADDQSKRSRQPILTNVDHPYFDHFDVTPEELAHAKDLRFFEVANQFGAAIHTKGDPFHPSIEKLWDVANTIRIAKLKCPPLYGLGSDDSHSHHEFSPHHYNPGRGWIMVRAARLTAESLIEAMNRGDFYASTGVVLRDLAYDAQRRTIRLDIEPEPNVHYTIQFIGTVVGTDPTGKPLESVAKKGDRPGCKYSPNIGQVLASSKSTSATYQLTGNELYVRALVRSDKSAKNAPDGGVQTETAWCQPVGWEGRVKR